MMKKLIKLMPAMALAMFVNQTQAQWTTTGTTVHPTTLTNNVSIGTTTNGANLYVEKSNAVTLGIKSTTAGATMFMDKGVSTANAAFAYRNLGVTIWNSGMLGSNNFAIRNVALNSTPILVNQTTDNVSLCSTGGNVAVGNVTPTYKLHVAGNASIKDALRIDGFAPKIDFTFGGGTEASMEDVAGTKFLISTKFNIPIQFTANGTTGLYVKNDSRMGMGTTNPQSNLHVYGIYPDLRIQGQNGLGTFNPVRMSFWSDPQGSAQEWRPGYIQSDDSAGGTWTGIMRFFTNGTSYANRQNSVEGMRIINGRVGIYDTVPDVNYRLSVGGNMRVKGNRIQLDNKWITSPGFYELEFGADVTADADNLYYSGSISKRWVAVYATNGTIQTSDARMKKEIKDLPYGLNEVMKLQPIIYKWKDEKLGDDNNLGFIAQDLQKVVKEVVVDHTTRFNPETQKMETTKNDVLGVKYSELIPVLVKAIQEQQEQITTLKNENASMQDCLNSVCNNATESKTKNVNTETSNALFQNQPNPFNQTTEIRFALTVDSKSANIIIRNLNGEQIKAIALNQTGKGQVTINANELAQGTYTYTLIVNGESVDTKLMVVTK
nr:tail fiber domain-containing protein [Bacteroidota bacterium]